MGGLVFLFGLLMGSFYNVVAFRLLKGQSPVYPPSHCPACQHRLGFWDLIPLLSYFLLKGKCRYCQASISPLYPLGEGLCALSFYLVYQKTGLSRELVTGWALASLLVLSVLTDLRQKIILDKITFPMLALILLLRLWTGEGPWWWYPLGGLVGAGVLGSIAALSRGGLGGGDVKLYLPVGVALGPGLTLLSISLAALSGALLGGLLMAMGRIRRRDPLPFAPFIWLGTMVAYLYGTELWDWYSHLWS